MIVGHYAAALVARPHLPRAPFWLLLLAANAAEFLWLLLALVGVEPTTPASLFDATFQGLKVDMLYSHDLLPNLILSALFAGAVYVYYKDRALALWCGLLCHAHVWSDYLVGFQHHWNGPDTMAFGLNSYERFPVVAILLELAFAWLCIAYYLRGEWRAGRALETKRAVLLLVVFSVGILAWLPNATVSMREWAVRLGLL